MSGPGRGRTRLIPIPVWTASARTRARRNAAVGVGVEQLALTNPSSLPRRCAQSTLIFPPFPPALPLVSAHVTYACLELDSNDPSPPYDCFPSFVLDDLQTTCYIPRQLRLRHTGPVPTIHRPFQQTFVLRHPTSTQCFHRIRSILSDHLSRTSPRYRRACTKARP